MSSKSALRNQRRIGGSSEQNDDWICDRTGQALNLKGRLVVTLLHFFGQDGLTISKLTMYLKLVADSKIGEKPWVPLAVKHPKPISGTVLSFES